MSLSLWNRLRFLKHDINSTMKEKNDNLDYIQAKNFQPKSRILTTPNAGEDMEQQELSFIVFGNAKWCSHFGRQFSSFL